MRFARVQTLLLLLLLSAPAWADKVDDLVAKEMAKQGIPGMAIAITKDGKLTKAQGYGVASLELRTPVTPETLLQIGSLTKQFAASAVMLLIQERKMRIEDPIGKYLPESPPAWRGITVKHLLQHTSGLMDWTEFRTKKLPPFDFMSQPTPQAFVRRFAAIPLLSKPGDKYHYSSVGYSLLGIAVEKVEGKSLGEVFEQRLFRPVAMTNTKVNDWRRVTANRAAGYVRAKNQPLENGLPLRPAVTAASGSVVSTVLDLAKWDVALRTDTPLPLSIRTQMWTDGKTNAGKSIGYGFGWKVKDGLIEHTGTTGAGFRSAFSRNTKSGVTVILLCNLSDVDSLKLAHAIAEAYAAEPIP